MRLGIFTVFENIFTANIYTGNAGEDSGKLYFPCGGAPLANELVSQYRCLNLPKKYESDANALS